MRKILSLKDVKRFTFSSCIFNTTVNVIAQKVMTENYQEKWRILWHDHDSKGEDYWPSSNDDGWGRNPINDMQSRWVAWLYYNPETQKEFWVTYN